MDTMRPLFATSVVTTVALVASGCGGSSPSSSPKAATNALPSISWVSPASSKAGAAGFTLIVEGSNFSSSSVVQWNGNNRSTSYVRPTQLTAAITDSDLATAGSASVAVANSTAGGTSASVSFSVHASGAPSTSWPEPQHDENGLLINVATDLTSLEALNSVLGGPLFAAWDPANAGRTGMKIMMFGGTDAFCPPDTSGPLSSFPDAVLAADGYPGLPSAVPIDMRFTPTPAASCTSAAAGKYGPAIVFLDATHLWLYTAALGKPTDLLKPYPPGGVRQGGGANLVNTSVNYQVTPDVTVYPWVKSGRARVAALAQIVRIRAEDASALTQSGQGMSIYLINRDCMSTLYPGRLCQMTWTFPQVVARSDISDWSTQPLNATVYADPVQNSLPVVSVGLIPDSGEAVTDAQYGLAVLTSRGIPTQHAAFAPARTDVEIEFDQLENAIRLVSAQTLGEPMQTDAKCSQCIQVFGTSWNDPPAWVLSTVVSSQEIYDESGTSGEILGGYSWLYAGPAP